MTAPEKQAVEAERDAFEKWMAAEYPNSSLKRADDALYGPGAYCSVGVRNRFIGWCAALASVLPQTWIAVSERLPEADVDVLFVADGHVSVGFKADSDPENRQWFDRAWTDRDGDLIDTYDVTHWMPLPAPPNTPMGEDLTERRE